MRARRRLTARADGETGGTPALTESAERETGTTPALAESAEGEGIETRRLIPIGVVTERLESVAGRAASHGKKHRGPNADACVPTSHCSSEAITSPSAVRRGVTSRARER